MIPIPIPGPSEPSPTTGEKAGSSAANGLGLQRIGWPATESQ